MAAFSPATSPRQLQSPRQDGPAQWRTSLQPRQHSSRSGAVYLMAHAPAQAINLAIEVPKDGGISIMLDDNQPRCVSRVMEATIVRPRDAQAIVGPQGQRLIPCITTQSCGSTRLSAGMVVMPPATSSLLHHHANTDIVVMCVRGWAARADRITRKALGCSVIRFELHVAGDEFTGRVVTIVHDRHGTPLGDSSMSTLRGRRFTQ